MQRRGPILPVLLALVAPACGSEHLSLSLTLDAEMRSRVVRFVIDVLEPPDDSWACDSVAFDERTATEIQSVLVATTSITVGTRIDAALGVQRAAHQLIVTYGYGDDGAWLVAGCNERSRGASDSIDIAAVRVAQISAPLESDLVGDAPGQLPASVAITVHDVLAEPLIGTTIRWTTDGPGGFTRVAETLTDELGVARYERELGAMSGPYGLHARAPWTLGARSGLASFEPTQIATFPLSGEPQQAFALAATRRPEQVASVVGRVGSSTCASAVFAIADGATSFTAASNCPVLGLAAVGNTDQAFTVAVASGSVEVSRLAGVDPVTLTDCGSVVLPGGYASCKPTAAFDADPCGGSGRLLVLMSCLVATSAPGAIILDVATCPAVAVAGATGFALLPSDSGVAATGCLDVNGVPTNSAVLRSDTRDLLVSDAAPSVTRRVKGLTTLYDFSTLGGRHTLLGSGTEAGVTQLTAFTVIEQAGDDGLAVDTLATFAVSGAPLAAATGDLDGDGILDAFGLLKGGGGARQDVLLCVGRETARAVCASGPELRTEGHTLTLVSDVDGDGFSEYVSVEHPGNSAWRVQAGSLRGRAP